MTTLDRQKKPLVEEITLRPTGAAPIAFRGTLRGFAAPAENKRSNRWHSIALYQDEWGGWFASVVYETDWHGEDGQTTIIKCDHAQKLDGALNAYDPAEAVVGYPANEKFAVRQERLLKQIKSQYDSLVSELLAAPEFARVQLTLNDLKVSLQCVAEGELLPAEIMVKRRCLDPSKNEWLSERVLELAKSDLSESEKEDALKTIGKELTHD